jgi:hypothetical protein
MGSVISTIGDVVGGAADAVGSAVGGIGDAIGSVVNTVADNLNPATIAAIVYFASTGDPSALIEAEGSAAGAEATLSSLGQAGYENVLSQYGNTGELINRFQPVVDSGALYSSGLGSGSVLSGDLAGIVDTASGVTDPALQNFTSDATINPSLGWSDSTGSILDASGNVIADATATKTLTDAGMSLGDIYNYVKNGLSIANLTGLISSGGSKLLGLMPSSTAVGQIFSSLGSLAPLAAAGGLGYLGYKNQADINQTITDAYNNYLGKQSGIASAYGVGQGPQQLNYNVAGVPLAQAQPRTAAQTVVTPKAANGGSINDLFDEYSMLNNRMRNYRRLARGGLI